MSGTESRIDPLETCSADDCEEIALCRVSIRQGKSHQHSFCCIDHLPAVVMLCVATITEKHKETGHINISFPHGGHIHFSFTEKFGRGMKLAERYEFICDALFNEIERTLDGIADNAQEICETREEFSTDV